MSNHTNPHVQFAHEILSLEDGIYECRGGVGNSLFAEIKIENGRHYRRFCRNEDWEEINVGRRISEKLFDKYFRIENPSRAKRLTQHLKRWLRIE